MSHSSFLFRLSGHNQRADYSATFPIHAGSFRVYVVHRTLTWTTWSLTCVRDHSYAGVYTRGLCSPTVSQHNIFDSEKLVKLLFVLLGTRTWVLECGGVRLSAVSLLVKGKVTRQLPHKPHDYWRSIGAKADSNLVTSSCRPAGHLVIAGRGTIVEIH